MPFLGRPPEQMNMARSVPTQPSTCLPNHPITPSPNHPPTHPHTHAHIGQGVGAPAFCSCWHRNFAGPSSASWEKKAALMATAKQKLRTQQGTLVISIYLKSISTKTICQTKSEVRKSIQKRKQGVGRTSPTSGKFLGEAQRLPPVALPLLDVFAQALDVPWQRGVDAQEPHPTQHEGIHRGLPRRKRGKQQMTSVNK